MSGYDAERLARLIGCSRPRLGAGCARLRSYLPPGGGSMRSSQGPKPTSHSAARSLPTSRPPLLAEGYEPERRVLDELRRRLADV
jgi:hypothetical protein